jgi:hypothetical protein
MRRLIRAALMSLGCVPVLAAGTALGQAPLRPGLSMPNQPTVSPFINLARTQFQPGTVNAIDYYGIVRPELRFSGALSGLEQQVANNQELITTGVGGAAGPVITGNAAVFMNTGSYFMTGAGARGTTGPLSTASIGRNSVLGAYRGLPTGGTGGVQTGFGAPPAAGGRGGR